MEHNFVMQIDDDHFVIENQKRLAVKNDHSKYFTAIHDAFKALKLLENIEICGDSFPRYIILDLRMPNMHGIEFLEAFENRFPQKKYETQIIIASSRISPDDFKQINKYNFVTDYIIKPIPAHYIENLINGMIG
ncbi:MAG TPA: response regulator [Bacteroidales bacterium]|nr:response regulator [Bacteroidales bacterium]